MIPINGGSRIGNLEQLSPPPPPSHCGGAILVLNEMLNLVRLKSIYITRENYAYYYHLLQTHLKLNCHPSPSCILGASKNNYCVFGG